MGLASDKYVKIPGLRSSSTRSILKPCRPFAPAVWCDVSVMHA